MTCHLDKEIYRVSNVDESQDASPSEVSPMQFNTKCYLLLKEQKDKITKYNQTKKWDKYKKFMNDYELVFTSSAGFPNVSQYSPISRSFFKMWEILHDFKEELELIVTQPQSLKVCSVAEGPGGFIEAIIKYRHDVVGRPRGCDQYYGMTLISNSKNVPNWKFTRDFIKHNNITLCYGKDGTGSLYKPHNIVMLSELAGKNTCHLVTGDGGFDYSNDFNEQEETSIPLMMCEVLTASMVQRKGGAFILKIFDISQPRMFQIMYFLYRMYDSVNLTKPFSSRPANSEKYLVCIGYKGPNPQLQQALFNAISVESLTDKVRNFMSVPLAFQKEIVYFNTHYTANQILSIHKTLDFIDRCESATGTNQSSLINNTIHYQLESAIRWCHKYKLPINLPSLAYYKRQNQKTREELHASSSA